MSINPIELYMAEKGLTRLKLAEVSGLDYGTVTRACSGKPIREDNLAKLADVLIGKVKDVVEELAGEREKLAEKRRAFIRSWMEFRDQQKGGGNGNADQS